MIVGARAVWRRGADIKGNVCATRGCEESVSTEISYEAIKKFLLLESEDRLQMEAKSRLLATAQSWNSVCSQLDDMYSEILNRKRGEAIVAHRCGD